MKIKISGTPEEIAQLISIKSSTGVVLDKGEFIVNSKELNESLVKSYIFDDDNLVNEAVQANRHYRNRIPK